MTSGNPFPPGTMEYAAWATGRRVYHEKERKMKPYVIRHRGEMWWRPNRDGYTVELIAAGIYGQAEAQELCSNRSAEDKPIALTEALAGLEPGTVGGYFGVRQFLAMQGVRGA